MSLAEIAVKRVPGGPGSLCLIHGWGSNAAIWAPLEDRLASLGSLFIVDLPGHGGSPLGPGLELETTAKAIARLLPRRTLIVGWSLGGLVALRLASRFPERISSLALVATNPRFTCAPDWPHAVAPEVLNAFAASLAGDFRETLKRFLALQVRGGDRPGGSLRGLRDALNAGGLPEPEALRQGLGILAGDDLRAELQSLSAPAALLLGERDTIVPMQVGAALKALKHDLRIEVLPGAGHAPFLSHPEAFVAWLETRLI